MTEFFVLLLIGATIYLWNRSTNLERRLDDVQNALGETTWRLEEVLRNRQAPQTPSEPASMTIAASRDETSEALTQQVEEEAQVQLPEPELEEQQPEGPVQPSTRIAEDIETPAPEPAWQETQPSRFSQFDFEDIFGRRLPIWAGGIALAIAGIFLVRYSIEAGLITPVVRVILSFLFGLALIAGAEAAYRFEDKVRDERVRQALAGAGIATLFGAFYLAGTSYGLIGATAAFIGLAAVSAGAIALSFRFGLPCAILGLVGGFAAPVLVDSDSANVPLLALYLGLVTGGLAWTGEKQGHRWLGYIALGIGLGWGLLMQLAGVDNTGDLAALGLYLIVLGTALPAFFAFRNGATAPQLAAAGIATLQMAVLVGNAGFAPLTWGLYLLIAAALAGLGWRFADLRPGSAIAAFVGFWLLALWPDPSPDLFAGVVAAMAVLFVGVPLLYQHRGEATLLERAQIAFMALGLAAVSYFQFGDWDSFGGPVALIAGIAGLALLPLAALALRWRSGEALTLRDDLPLLGSGHALLFLTALMILPGWTAPLCAALLALAVVALMARRLESDTLLVAGWSAIAVSVLALLLSPGFEDEALKLSGQGAFAPQFTGLLRWAACCVPLLVMGALRSDTTTRPIADGLAASLGYGALAQVVPGDALAWLAALAAFGIVVLREARAGGWGVLLTIAGFWIVAPLAKWAFAGGLALAGEPFLATEAIAPTDLALRIAPFALAAAAFGWRASSLPRELSLTLFAVAGGLATVALHSLYKLAWSIDSLLRFEWYGLGERTIWQVLLIAAGLAATQLVKGDMGRRIRMALLVVALAHFAWFTLLLHNPLHAVQHVGPTPIANWLTAAYGLAIAALVLLREDLARLTERARPGAEVAIMVLVALLAVSLLRQLFAGTVLTATVIGANESLLLSLLGIALALGFLWWGSVSSQRIWRIGSLVLILGAVLKVFLIDAAGLSGLLRIASFMALGFSLIGIGWVYSRQLRRSAGAAAPETG